MFDFTIITPNLNYAKYLRDCLQSVAEQENVTVQHIVMDGGSTDGSEAICKSFPHAEWISQADNGMSQAINRGFDIAQGKWVMWLNADDRLEKNILSKLLEKIKNSQADVVYGDFRFINEQGEFLRDMKLPQWSLFVNVHHHCYIGSTAAFYRNETIIKKGFRLREDFRYVMDGEFYARLHSAGKIFLHVPLCIADFRLHGMNASMHLLGKNDDMDVIVKAEKQHVESRAIRRKYGITVFSDPYLNGLVDGVLWIAARVWKNVLRIFS